MNHILRPLPPTKDRNLNYFKKNAPKEDSTIWEPMSLESIWTQQDLSPSSVQEEVQTISGHMWLQKNTQFKWSSVQDPDASCFHVGNIMAMCHAPCLKYCLICAIKHVPLSRLPSL